MDELHQARLDTIVELSNALLKTTQEILLVHGNDPKLEALLSSGYTLAIRQLNKISPGFREYMIAMLEADNK
jgi:hypothetical protein